MLPRLMVFRARQGLCNRIRGLLCAIGAAETTGRRLFVVWEPGVACEARLDDLWSTSIPVAGWVQARVLARLAGGTSRPEVLPSRYPIVYVHTQHLFALELQPRPWIENYRRLELRSELQERVDEVVAEIGDRPVVGAAIRAHAVHAHEKSRTESPPNWYEDRIEAILRSHPGCAIFVSSDDPEITQRWQARWPDDVFALRGKGGYATVRGVQDALCDLHVLAGSAYLLGAHWSSLSTVAGIMQGGETVETSRTSAKLDVATAIAQQPRYGWPTHLS